MAQSPVSSHAKSDKNSLADRMENINARFEIIGIRRNSVHCFGTG